VAKMQIKPKQILSNASDKLKPIEKKISPPPATSNKPVEKLEPSQMYVKKETPAPFNPPDYKKEPKTIPQDHQSLNAPCELEPLPNGYALSNLEQSKEVPSNDETLDSLSSHSKPCVPQETALYNVKLARAYVPYQKFCTIYMPVESLLKGTIFPELYEPYTESRR
jgi:hypothetical protein